MKNLLCLAVVLLIAIATYAQECNWNDEAQRHFTRATAAVKEAKNDADYLDAIEEFKKVLESAPDCPDIYYNIALCYDKSSNAGRLKDISGCEQAITYLKKYLALKPNAPDKQAVQNRIEELGYRQEKLNKLLPEMVYVEGGTFRMGSNQGKDREKNAHQVTLSSFYIGKYEITQAQWEEVMGTSFSLQKTKGDEANGAGNPIYDGRPSIIGEGDGYPMYYVSWEGAQEFIRRLNEVTGKQFRLPTEAEWEYAAHGGNKSKEYKYIGGNNRNDVAWNYDNSKNSTHPVGTKQPNELGIYDMSGNVWEWCSDWYGNYNKNAITSPQGPLTGSERVRRGGCFSSIWDGPLTSTYRSHIAPNNMFDIGFRLACNSE